MDTDRRNFLYGIAAASAYPLVANSAPGELLSPVESVKLIDSGLLPELQTFMGVQPTYNSGKAKSLVFVLTTRSPSGIDFFRGETDLSYDVAEFSFIIDKRVVNFTDRSPVVDLTNPTGCQRLKAAAVHHLLTRATTWSEYRQLVSKRSTYPPPEAIESVFDIMRVQNTIVLRSTLRGRGNVMIGCREGIEEVKRRTMAYHNKNYNRMLDGYWTKNITKVVEVEPEGEPFALIGYNGANRYDAGMILALSMQSPIQTLRPFSPTEPFRVQFIDHNIKDYWIRIL